MPLSKAALRVILFDLDGTLADTAPDLGLALNMQRERHGLAPLPQAQIRPYASHGSKGLLSLGFGLKPQDVTFPAMRDEYLGLYDQVFTRSPALFEGMTELLTELDTKGLRWGVVTNKPRRFTEPLLNVLNLTERAACVVCGDDASRSKPYPDTLLMAAAQLAAKPSSCLYLGDAERDIQAGQAADMHTVVALFGYIHAADKPHEWGADAMISAPAELLAFCDSL